MAKKSEAEVLLGFKRICPSCNTRYYDMAKMPPTCPNCSTEYNPEALLKSRRNRPIEDEEEVKIKPRKMAASDDVDEETDAPEVADDEEEAVEGYAELDGEAELAPDEDGVEDIALDADADDEEEDDDVLEDTSDLGDDDVGIEVEIENDEEER